MFSTLIAGVPEWERAIQKMECANHACECYRTSLKKLVLCNTAYKGKGGLTGKMRQRLTSAARCAIKMHSKEANQKDAIKKLQRDLQNGPFHCFGMHTNCSSDFCNTVREKQQQNEMVDNHGSTEDESLDDIPQIAVDQVMLSVMHNHLHIDYTY